MDAGPEGAAQPQRHTIEFSASGSEYFRIWIVNLLLIVITLGLYLPWAKVRKLRYFYSNTWIDGDALDFHGEPRKMLRGTLIAGAFLAAYSLAGSLSAWAALVAAIAFVALWPQLFRASMRFRLANTSWRGLRLRFAGDVRGAYASMGPPLALALLPVALVGALAGPAAGARPRDLPPVLGGLVGLGVLALVLGVPYFLWRVKRYQHDHYALGALQTRLTADLGVVYGLFIKGIGITVLAALVMVVALAVAMVPGGRSGTGAGRVLAMASIGLLGVLCLNVLPKSYLQVRLQNLWWSHTGNEWLRFHSDLRWRGFFGLQLANYLLIFLTLGLYWPFAVVRTRRAQIEAVQLHTRIALDRITRAARSEDPGAAGDMAADLFGLDIGM